MNFKSTAIAGWSQALVASLLTGAFVIPFKLLSEKVDPASGVFLMFVCACVLNFCLFLFEKEKKMKISKNSLFLFLATFFAIAGNVLGIMAIKNMHPALMNVIQRTEIIFLIIFGMIFFKEKFLQITWGALFLIFLGVILMHIEETDQSIEKYQAPFYALLSGMCFALFQVSNKFLLKDYSPPVINMVRIVLTLLIMVWIPGIAEDAVAAEKMTWLWAFLSAFCGPFLGRLLYTFALKHIEISRIGYCQSLSPVFSLGFQFIFLNEIVTFYQLSGAFIILTAVLGFFIASEKIKTKSKG